MFYLFLVCLPIFLNHLFLLLQRPSSRHEELKERARHLLEQARREAQTRGPQRSLSKVIILHVLYDGHGYIGHGVNDSFLHVLENVA